MSKTVYVRSADDIDEARFAAKVAAARKYGAVVVGLVTDEASRRSGRTLQMDFEARRQIINRIEGVAQILAQNDYDGMATLRRLQPDYCFCDPSADSGADAGSLLALAGEWHGQLIALEGAPRRPRTPRGPRLRIRRDASDAPEATAPPSGPLRLCSRPGGP
ncbi:hypothetical protein ACRAWD_31930 [Caulobacter segnis]